MSTLTMADIEKAISLLPPKTNVLSGRVITSSFCYKTKTVVRGIHDLRRPNNRKPLYRKVTITISLMYRIGGDIVCHPSLIPKLENALKRV